MRKVLAIVFISLAGMLSAQETLTAVLKAGLSPNHHQKQKYRSVSNKSLSDTIGSRDVYLIFMIGQSNSVGWASASRLANTKYNYRGIFKGYPAVRTSQEPYTRTPSNVRIYYKPVNYPSPLSEYIADNGEWQAYVAGVNSGTVPDNFGAELSLAQNILDIRPNAKVYLVKAGIGNTVLAPNGLMTPGNWSNTLDTIATKYYLDRAIRDLKAELPDARIIFPGVFWWQGEGDSEKLSREQYMGYFMDNLKSDIDKHIHSSYPEFGDYPWVVTQLNYRLTVGEDSLNLGYRQLSEKYADIKLASAVGYPRRQELTAGEAAPLAIAAADDKHSSYIAQLAVGEQYFNIIRKRLWPDK
jgi:hypothetical protein